MLKIKNLKKTYGDFSLNCSMEVMPGRVTGLVGQNGAGKSTIFKAALGLIYTDDGGRATGVEIFRKDLSQITPQDKERIGVVLADSGFSNYFTIKDISCILKTMYREYDHHWFLQQCQRFCLPMNKKIKELSLGMRTKLKLLVAMCHRASLLLLDEPMTGLDVVAREELLDMLRDYMDRGENPSILISSHISTDLENFCDDFYMIHEGEMILREETDVLLSNYAVLKIEKRAFDTLDKQYILRCKKEAYGYRCLTNQRQFYLENYPGIILEKGRIDDLVIMMAGGKAL